MLAITMVTEDTKFTEDEPQTLNRAWNHPYLELQRDGKRLFKKSSAIERNSSFEGRNLKVLGLLIVNV